MNTFFLKVIASDKVFFSGKAEMVNIPTLDGEKVFLAHHENIVIAIEMGDLKFRTEDGETHHAVVGKGFARSLITVSPYWSIRQNVRKILIKSGQRKR